MSIGVYSDQVTMLSRTLWLGFLGMQEDARSIYMKAK
jgi:hypothetical protein